MSELSRETYIISAEITDKGYPFYALIAAAMRQTDDFDVIKLRRAFPGTWADLQARHGTPGGYLEREQDET